MTTKKQTLKIAGQANLATSHWGAAKRPLAALGIIEPFTLLGEYIERIKQTAQHYNHAVTELATINKKLCHQPKHRIPPSKSDAETKSELESRLASLESQFQSQCYEATCQYVTAQALFDTAKVTCKDKQLVQAVGDYLSAVYLTLKTANPDVLTILRKVKAQLNNPSSNDDGLVCFEPNTGDNPSSKLQSLSAEVSCNLLLSSYLAMVLYGNKYAITTIGELACALFLTPDSQDEANHNGNKTLISDFTKLLKRHGQISIHRTFAMPLHAAYHALVIAEKAYMQAQKDYDTYHKRWNRPILEAKRLANRSQRIVDELRAKQQKNVEEIVAISAKIPAAGSPLLMKQLSCEMNHLAIENQRIETYDLPYQLKRLSCANKKIRSVSSNAGALSKKSNDLAFTRNIFEEKRKNYFDILQKCLKTLADQLSFSMEIDYLFISVLAVEIGEAIKTMEIDAQAAA